MTSLCLDWKCCFPSAAGEPVNSPDLRGSARPSSNPDSETSPASPEACLQTHSLAKTAGCFRRGSGSAGLGWNQRKHSPGDLGRFDLQHRFPDYSAGAAGV